MRVIDIPGSAEGFALALHGGAGGRPAELAPEEEADFKAALTRAHEAGRSVLAADGSALDAVCASVEELENCPLFNAGHGAALTARGEAELDASVMTGDGRAGAVAVARAAKNPVFAARKVMEETRHVLIVAPSEELLASWGLSTVDPSYFVTEARRQQLAKVQSAALEAPRHGTVGAVAMDSQGRLAAATSTGGIVDQRQGRIGDTPIIGAGNYARDGVVAVSCTGVGEAFIEGVVAHDIYARMHHAGAAMADAVSSVIKNELEPRSADGGIIAVGADGRVVIAYNSTAMFAAYRDESGALATLT